MPTKEAEGRDSGLQGMLAQAQEAARHAKEEARHAQSEVGAAALAPSTQLNGSGVERLGRGPVIRDVKQPCVIDDRPVGGNRYTELVSVACTCWVPSPPLAQVRKQGVELASARAEIEQFRAERERQLEAMRREREAKRHAEEAVRAQEEKVAVAERALTKAKEELQALARDCNRIERARAQLHADAQQEAKEHAERVQSLEAQLSAASREARALAAEKQASAAALCNRV